jgi:hypothetical protein
MPFDAAGFPPAPPRPERRRSGDNVVTALIIVLSVALLVMPVSLAALMDIAHYLQTR